MKKIWKFSFTILLLAGLVTSAFAFSGKGDGVMRNEDISKLTYEQFEEKTSSCNGRMKDQITEENFEKIQAMHEARMNNDWDTVMNIKEELGISNRGMGNGMNQKRINKGSCNCQK